VSETRSPFLESYIKFRLGYEPRWCPYFATCRHATDHPRCSYPFYLVCDIYRSRKALGFSR